MPPLFSRAQAWAAPAETAATPVSGVPWGAAPPLPDAPPAPRPAPPPLPGAPAALPPVPADALPPLPPAPAPLPHAETTTASRTTPSVFMGEKYRRPGAQSASNLWMLASIRLVI